MDLRGSHGRRIRYDQYHTFCCCVIWLHPHRPSYTERRKTNREKGGVIAAVSACGRGLEPNQTTAKKQGLFEYTPFSETYFSSDKNLKVQYLKQDIYCTVYSDVNIQQRYCI
jgi:hypothetical protein